MVDKLGAYSETYNPSVSFADSSLYTREPGLRKGRFQSLHKVADGTQKLLFIFHKVAEAEQKQIFVFL